MEQFDTKTALESDDPSLSPLSTKDKKIIIKKFCTKMELEKFKEP
jgi:hypothetical protein